MNDDNNENAQEMTITSPCLALFGPKVCVILVLFHVLLIVFILFRFDLVLNQWKGLGFAGDNNNGPKRRVWCRFGPMYVIFFLSCFFITY